MVRSNFSAKVIYDPSQAYVCRSGSGRYSHQRRNFMVYDPSQAHVHRSRSRQSAGEQRNFMSSSLADMYKGPSSSGPANNLDSENEEIDMRKILKDIEYLRSSSMSWKERKRLENEKVVGLGGKPPRRQRLPLSVAKVPMKRQKLREQKKLREDTLLGLVQKKKKRTSERSEKRKPEDGVLMASEGFFKKGVLNVKHLLGPKKDDDVHMSTGNKKRKGKRKKH